ncbi:Protein phosphatase 2C 2 [Mortierella sp. AM989]|nr:Protein phosphatase 2C 2 [Mortierella sp. AM989]
MGQTLSAPITEKDSSAGQNERFAYGVSSMQGWRSTMEDAHTTLMDLEEAQGTAFFAVYDGHGGPNVAKCCSQDLHKKIVTDPAFIQGDYKKAISNGFLEMDNALRQNPQSEGDISGCTAITATVTDKNILYVGNAGDSRAVLGSNGKAIALSVDHKPSNIAGGFVEAGRVNGMLALSRALGDFEYKQNQMLDPEEQIVIANPDVVEHKLTADDEFMVLACDGIWECMGSKTVVKIVRERIADGLPLEKICESLMDDCLAPMDKLTSIGCDNMTVIIVAFLNGMTLEQWYKHIRSRIAV